MKYESKQTVETMARGREVGTQCGSKIRVMRKFYDRKGLKVEDNKFYIFQMENKVYSIAHAMKLRCHIMLFSAF